LAAGALGLPQTADMVLQQPAAFVDALKRGRRLRTPAGKLAKRQLAWIGFWQWHAIGAVQPFGSSQQCLAAEWLVSQNTTRHMVIQQLFAGCWM
jgi:hypothetical protein